MLYNARVRLHINRLNKLHIRVTPDPSSFVKGLACQITLTPGFTELFVVRRKKTGELLVSKITCSTHTNIIIMIMGGKSCKISMLSKSTQMYLWRPLAGITANLF